MMKRWGLILLVMACVPAAQAGELEISAYGGGNSTQDSEGTLSNGSMSRTDTITWDGKSFDPPIYYGVRVTYWPEAMPDWGVALDLTHAKSYADIPGSGVDGTYDRLEFTDGLNLLTLNGLRRFQVGGKTDLYAGVGAGLTIPHVEVTTTPASLTGPSSTFGYQVTGWTAQAMVGLSYEVVDNLKVFGEYRIAYSSNEATLDGGAGTFSSDMTTHHAAIGLSYAFDAPGP